MNLEKGGRGAIERMVEAYGFKTRQALCDHLGISKSTLATRYMRDSFPAEWVIRCALETKADLAWLVSGAGVSTSSHNENTIILDKFDLVDGVLFESGFISIDQYLLPEKTSGLVLVHSDKDHFVCDKEFHLVRDGKWLVSIDKEFSFRELTRLPKNKILVSCGNKEFECSLGDIDIIGSVILSIK
ncbi:phage repressor protein CI [Citrobacter freundii]|uniref:phage repressor protein CI n=1 Tax=Citrobacter freundii TaxID=546 RepID=UPI002433CB77|nr:phage repressor protein CI [Citrobacter freundii]WFV07158.1 helix-turn-helix domain-containing protein [Citrobacter freundii]